MGHVFILDLCQLDQHVLNRRRGSEKHSIRILQSAPRLLREAGTPQAAEYKARRSMDIDWHTSDSDVEVESIHEIDEDGSETEIEVL